MLEQQPAPARLTFSPDQLAYNGYASVADDFIACLRVDGAAHYLTTLHENSKDKPMHELFAHVREIFDRQYRNDEEKTRLGEAYVDGALIATVIAEQHYQALMPQVVDSVETDLDRYINRYAIFSERQEDFINAVREDGAEQYGRYHRFIFPIVNHVNNDKYGSSLMMAAMAEGASFVFDRVRTTQRQDYVDFQDEMEWMDFLFPDPAVRQKMFGDEVLSIISRHEVRD